MKNKLMFNHKNQALNWLGYIFRQIIKKIYINRPLTFHWKPQCFLYFHNELRVICRKLSTGNWFYFFFGHIFKESRLLCIKYVYVINDTFKRIPFFCWLICNNVILVILRLNKKPVRNEEIFMVLWVAKK